MDKYTTDAYIDSLIHVFRSRESMQYYKIRLKEIDDDILVCNHELSGLAKHPIELTKEQAKSNKPMPTSQHNGMDEQKRLDLIDRKERLEKEREEKQSMLDNAEKAYNDCMKVLSRLPDWCLEMMTELYIENRTPESLAIKYCSHYGVAYGHASTVYRTIKNEIKKIL